MLKHFLALICLSSSLFAQTPKTIDVQNCSTVFVDRITFSTERTGVIADVPEEGDMVTKGDIVVRLKDDVPKAVLAVNEARADSEIEIEAARKAAEGAKLEHDAAREANKYASPNNPSFPATRIQRLRLDAEAAELQVNQAEFEKRLAELTRDQAQAELESYWVIAEIGGVVTRVFKHVGEGVQQGEAIIQVVNQDRLRVEGYIDTDQSYVKKGMAVKAVFSVPDAEGVFQEIEYEGTLGFVDLTVQELSKKIRVWAEIDNSDGKLREGLPVSMTIMHTPKAAPAN